MFADDRVGWVCGGKNTILKTVDGGNSWSRLVVRLAEADVEVAGIWFADQSTGWAAGRVGRAPALLKSIDGGTSWSVAHLWPQPDDANGPPGAMLDVRFADALHGWAVGFNGPKAVIVGTRDGGKRWETEYSGGEITRQFSEVRFADASNGWALSGSGVMMTADGGQSWDLRYFDSGLLSDLAVLDDGEVWLAGAWGSLRHTTNGVAWPEVKVRGLEDGFIGWVTFRDRGVGWAAGTSGEVLATHDGGKTWERADIPRALLGADPSTREIAATNSNLFVIANPGRILVRAIQ